MAFWRKNKRFVGTEMVEVRTDDRSFSWEGFGGAVRLGPSILPGESASQFPWTNRKRLASGLRQ